MSDEAIVSAEEQELAAIEERRAKRREAMKAARRPQEVIDNKAIDNLEEEHGFDRLRVLRTPYFREGLPAAVVVKSPGGTSYWKRFQDQIRDAKGNKQLEGAAQDMLARACIVYPADAEVLKAMCVEFPNLLNDSAGAAATLGKLDMEGEKKD